MYKSPYLCFGNRMYASILLVNFPAKFIPQVLTLHTGHWSVVVVVEIRLCKKKKMTLASFPEISGNISVQVLPGP